MNTVRVNLSERGYEIRIGAGNLADLGSFVAGQVKLTRAVIIADA